MPGWARVEETDPGWKARIEEAERRFFPRTEFVVSGPSRRLGEIRNGSVLDLTADPGRELDRRLGLATFVAIVLAEKGY
jgi:hypothetical protein